MYMYVLTFVQVQVSYYTSAWPAQSHCVWYVSTAAEWEGERGHTHGREGEEGERETREESHVTAVLNSSFRREETVMPEYFDQLMRV